MIDGAAEGPCRQGRLQERPGKVTREQQGGKCRILGTGTVVWAVSSGLPDLRN